MNNHQAFVITVQNIPESVKSAERCIWSAERFGIEIDHYDAFSPLDRPEKYLQERDVKLEGFKEKYSRIDRVIAAFCSHYSLWEYSRDTGREVMIFEHDAVVTNFLPIMNYKHVITFGKPSYGKYNTPMILGTNPLTHKRYFGGAHAYMVKPSGAKQLIEKAKTHAGPTDVFLNLDNFPWLEEYYPWFAEVNESFTTIQNEEGCKAKHMFNKDYRIV